MLSNGKQLYNLDNYTFASDKLHNALRDLQNEPISDYLKRFVFKLC